MTGKKVTYYDSISNEVTNRPMEYLYDAISDNGNNSPCVITGELSYKGGSYVVVPTSCDTICDAIKKCVDGKEKYEIAQFNGHLEITSVNKDISCFLMVYLLNPKGISAMDRIKNGSGKADLSKKCYHKRINGLIIESIYKQG